MLSLLRVRPFVFVCLLALFGCAGNSTTADADPGGGGNTAESSAASGPPKKLNAAHILIQHKDSQRASAGITRTKEEALQRAREVAAKAQAEGADFAALAREYSDGPSGPEGGDLGDFEPRMMIPEFSQATMKLDIGQVSDPVESPFGYHIILRKKVVGDLNAAHILIQYAGCARADDSITRSKEEAFALASEIADRARAEGADFAALAREYSDGPSARNGGDLGVFSPGRMVKAFSDATVQLQIGEISDPVESPFGFHVILRKPLPRRISARHILVQYAGSERADSAITRTKDQARARMAECLEKARAGTDFAALAREYSDGPSASRGGDLGEFPEGVMAPAFNDAAFALEVGQISDIVETPFGFHIIQRYR